MSFSGFVLLASSLGVATRFLPIPALGLCGFSVAMDPIRCFLSFTEFWSIFFSVQQGWPGPSSLAAVGQGTFLVGLALVASLLYYIGLFLLTDMPSHAKGLISLPLLQPAAVRNTPPFLQYLTTQLHQQVPGGLVLWYDSVVQSGQLKWQDELNEQNR